MATGVEVIPPIFLRNSKVKAPFPYFGKKTLWVDEVWGRLGALDMYIEPFAGSAVMLLNSPRKFSWEILNDKDSLLVNFWRAVKYAPGDVVDFLHGNGAFSDDLCAWKKHLTAWREGNRHKVAENPKFFDPEIAAWWCYVMTYSFRPSIETEARDVILTKNRVPRWGKNDLLAYFREICERLSSVFILNRDWEIITGGKKVNQPYQKREVKIGFFLDPPYRKERRKNNLYMEDKKDISSEVYAWAVSHGHRYRIAYCMTEGDYPVPDGWDFEIKKMKGYQNHNDCVIFSPCCAPPPQRSLW